MALTIPRRLQDTFLRLFNLDEDSRQSVLHSIQDTPPGSGTTDYRRSLDKLELDLPDGWSRQFVQWFFSLYNLGETTNDASETARDLVAALKSLDSETILEADATQFDSFETFIRDVLVSHNSLGIGAKAARLMLEHQRIFVFPEIFSDIRSVFGQDSVEEFPVTAVVTHMLKIHTHVENSRPEDVYFAMDIDDLFYLQGTVERAISKHETLSRMIEKLGIKQFAAEDDAV